MKKAVTIRIRGIVQGVGFRPFVYTTAKKYGISGNVKNDTEGVLIMAEGKEEDLAGFMKTISGSPPPLAMIDSISTVDREVDGFAGFSIEKSSEARERSTFIPPDTNVCEDCLLDFFSPHDRRHYYPFTTCTNCGPRFSIVTDIPYDRKNTTMDSFRMCEDCASEYTEPENRRFHTQPNACPACGPEIFLKTRDKETLIQGGKSIAAETVRLLRMGHIIAIKGVGGYLLACDALDDEPVSGLRTKKNRPFKPFAVMAGSMEIIKSFLHVSPAEEDLLLSKERPIVLLKEKKQLLSRYIAPSLSHIGIMLPYTPFQHHLFSIDRKMVLVMTSGNISEEPIIFRDDDAFDRLSSIADYFVTYDREIRAFSDDSVLFVENERPCFIRRSRGYVPMPFKSEPVNNELLAMGGDLKNSFALARGKTVILSQFIGDMGTPTGNSLFIESLNHYKSVFHFQPEVIVSDLHPGYFTTQYAGELAASGQRHIKVQHHHAHIASVMEEHNEYDKVIGIAFDGTGFGPDGNLWGGEFLLADRTYYERRAHFSYFPLPGGEQAIKDVWKIGLSLLYRSFGKDFPGKNNYSQAGIIMEIIDKKINSPMACSIGRLFDGVSSLLGLSQKVSTEAEAAQIIEESALRGAASNTKDDYIIPFRGGRDDLVISTEDLIRNIVEMQTSGMDTDDIAYLFHLSLVNTTLEIASILREKYSVNRVVLSGGAFQNRLLLGLIREGLEQKQFDILLPRKIPFNDGCMAIGQIAIAREMIK